jgi:hypothetical protein
VVAVVMMVVTSKSRNRGLEKLSRSSYKPFSGFKADIGFENPETASQNPRNGFSETPDNFSKPMNFSKPLDRFSAPRKRLLRTPATASQNPGNGFSEPRQRLLRIPETASQNPGNGFSEPRKRLL